MDAIFTHTGGIVITTALIVSMALFFAYLIFGTIHDEQKKRYEAEIARRNSLKQRNKAAHQQVTATVATSRQLHANFENSLLESSNPYVPGTVRYQAWNEKRG